MTHFRLLTLIVALVAATCPAHGELRVLAAGDSHTYRYSGQSFGYGTLFRWAYEQERNDVTELLGYYGGIRTQSYIDDGHITDALATDPDVIQLLLGTNDSAGEVSVATYSNNMTTILDAFTGYTNGRGKHPVVIVSTIMPMIAPDPYAATATPYIESYNAWLRNEAQIRDDFVLIDFDDALTSIEGWESYYSDGVHLDNAMTQYLTYGEYPAGYILLTEMFRDAAITALPEPGTAAALMLLIGTTVFFRPRG